MDGQIPAGWHPDNYRRFDNDWGRCVVDIRLEQDREQRAERDSTERQLGYVRMSPDAVFGRAEKAQVNGQRNPFGDIAAGIAALRAAWAAEEHRMLALGAHWDSACRKWRMPDGSLVTSDLRDPTGQPAGGWHEAPCDAAWRRREINPGP